MMKIFILSVFSLFLVSFVSAACSPIYLCSDWGQCNDGLQTRTCQDTLCNTEPIVERRLCSSVGEQCSPNYQCGDWSQCNYFGKSQDVLGGKLQFSGFQERECYDSNMCGTPFVEERKCTDSFSVNFVSVEKCGEKFVVALDKNSNREVSMISADAWKSKRLDISFVQNDFSFCPSCYNNVQDGDETGIDCGGSCKACLTENGKRNQIILISSSWLLSALLIGAFIFTTFRGNADKLRKSLYFAYKALETKDKAELQKHVSSIKKNYNKLSSKEKSSFDKDLDRFYRRI